MIEIKYICRPTGFCETPCPYGENCFVGSGTCQACERYVSSDDLIVKCKADETKED